MEICIKWNMCRACTAQHNSDLQPLFTENNAEIITWMKEYAQLTVEPTDGLPDKICKECIKKLQMVHDFVSACKKANEDLKRVVNQAMSTQSSFQNIIKTEDRSRKRKQCFDIADNKGSLTRANDRKDFEIELNCKDNGIEALTEDSNSISIDDATIEGCVTEPTAPSSPSKMESDDFSFSVGSATDTFIDEEQTEDDLSALGNAKNSKSQTTPLVDLSAACGTLPLTSYSCTVCTNRFAKESQLKVHQRTHHNTKHFECEICGKRFNAICNLTTHIRTHTGEKPYECQFCDRRFSDRSTHRKHERIHTNEKPFTCTICHKSFSLSTSLKAHEAVHSQEKPHRCLTCKKGFKLPHQLKAHLNTHSHRCEARLGLYNKEDAENC